MAITAVICPAKGWHIMLKNTAWWQKYVWTTCRESLYESEKYPRFGTITLLHYAPVLI